MKEWLISNEEYTDVNSKSQDDILTMISSHINKMEPTEVFLTVSDAIRKHPDMRANIIKSVENYIPHMLNG